MKNWKCAKLIAVMLSGCLLAQDKPAESKPLELSGEVLSSTVKRVEAVVDPETQVDFKTALLADKDGKRTNIELQDKVTIVEYWSRNANNSNLYWNRMRELEHKYADNPFVQIISVNYDFALGGEAQRKAAAEYLKKNTPPQTMLFDLDDGVRDIFSLTGTIGYMLFNHNRQYIYSGRGDSPETEEIFARFEEAVEKKEQWDEYVKKMVGRKTVRSPK